jgi:hypothetical protein
MSDFNIKYVKVHRTLEGTIFEIVSAIILVVVWVLAFTTKMFDGSEIQGKHIAIITLTVATIVLLAGAYFPRWINAGQELKNIRQVEIAIRMTRTIAVELAAFCLLMVAFSSHKAIIDIIHIAFTVSVIATIAIFNMFLNGAKS